MPLDLEYETTIKCQLKNFYYHNLKFWFLGHLYSPRDMFVGRSKPQILTDNQYGVNWEMSITCIIVRGFRQMCQNKTKRTRPIKKCPVSISCFITNSRLIVDWFFVQAFNHFSWLWRTTLVLSDRAATQNEFEKRKINRQNCVARSLCIINANSVCRPCADLCLICSIS